MFYKKVKSLCEKNGISITQMAKDLGISTGLQTGWKNGAMPQRRTIKKIADYFNMPIEFFYEGADIKDVFGVSETEIIHTINTSEAALMVFSNREDDLYSKIEKIAAIAKASKQEMPAADDGHGQSILIQTIVDNYFSAPANVRRAVNILLGVEESEE